MDSLCNNVFEAQQTYVVCIVPQNDVCYDEIPNDLRHLYRGLPLFVENGGNCSTIQEHLSAVAAPVYGTHVKWRVAVHILGVYLSAVVQQLFHVLHKTVFASLKCAKN